MDSEPIEPLNVFVSYRRADRPGHAGRVRDVLRQAFGHDRVFYDVATIRGGADFSVAIQQAIEKATVVVAIIGPEWGRHRLWDRLLSRPDWVRYEIEYARQAAKPILPIVVDGASMPRTLPPGLEFLATVNATALRDDSWDGDVEALIANLPVVATSPVETGPMEARRPRRRLTGLALAASVVLMAVLGTAWAVFTPPPGAVTGSDEGGDIVATVNQPPTTGSIEVRLDGDASTEFNQVIGLMSATRFVLTASGITDPDGDPLEYIWDFGDGSPTPESAPSVEKVYDRVSRFRVTLHINDGHLDSPVLAAETDITIRDVTGTWLLTLTPDPEARYSVPTQYEITLTQQGNQLSGNILPLEGTGRATILTGEVEHPTRVRFGSESAWWNDLSDAYFNLEPSDGFAFVQMRNLGPGCGGIPCLGAFAQKQ